MLDSKLGVVGIIPARGGSKGVPRKNIRLLAGKPLIAYTIEAALAAKSLDRVIVSTDDEEIDRIAKEYGAEVPFPRPKQLAEGTTPDLPVFQHALKYLEENENYKPDIIVHLRPTTPFKTGKLIDEAVDKLISTGADGIRTVCLVDYHPYWMKRLEDDRILPFMELDREYPRRQDLPPVYKANGVVDVTRRKFIMDEGRMLGDNVRAIFMELIPSLDIDTELDFLVAEKILEEGLIDSAS